MLGSDVAHALQDQGFGLRVQLQGQAQGGGRALACVVVRCRANATTRKDQIATGKGLRQGFGDTQTIVAHITRPTQRQTPLAELLDDTRHVFVLAFAREDFVANDDEADVHGCAIAFNGAVAPGAAIATGGMGFALTFDMVCSRKRCKALSA